LLKSIKIPEEVIKLAELRKAARENKDFELSDNIRDKITDLGYEIIDEGNDFHLKHK
jgi:cysteinyl-tRNA synthetase